MKIDQLQRRLEAIRRSGGAGTIVVDKRGRAALLVTKANDPIAAATRIFLRSRRQQARKPATER